MTTAPYAADVLPALSTAVGVVCEVDVYLDGTKIDTLVPTEATISYDEARAPYVTFDATLAWPAASTRNALDPRNDVRLAVSAGYVLPTGTEDVHPLATLRLTSADLDDGAETIRLAAASDETIVLGYPLTAALAFTATSSVVNSVRAVIDAAFPGETPAWDIDVSTTFQFGATPPAAVVGTDRWTLVTDWLDMIGARIWHDGETWHVSPAPAQPAGGQSAARLLTGPKGTIADLHETRAVDGYANLVTLVYTYSLAGVAKRTTVVASSGLTPVRGVTVTRDDVPPTDGAAAARTALLRGLRRGTTYTAAAVAMLWLRPRDVVTVAGPRLELQAVTFDLLAGTMDVEAQAPDPASAAAIPSITVTTTTETP